LALPKFFQRSFFPRSYPNIIRLLLNIVFLLGSCFIPVSLPKKVDQTYEPYNMIIDGQILFTPMLDTTTYLIDADGTVNHTWTSGYFPGLAVKWLGNGTILRTIQVGIGLVVDQVVVFRKWTGTEH
jgi:hypothetical protein